MILATRTVHGDPRYLEADRRPQVGPPPRPGLTAVAALLCVVLVAGSAPLLGPRLPGLIPPKAPMSPEVLEQWQNPVPTPPAPVMVDDDVSVRRTLMERGDVEVLRYTTDAPDPSYLRVRTLNRFDGTAFRADGADRDLGTGGEAFSDARNDGRALLGDDGRLVTTRMTLTRLGGDRLPVPEAVRQVTPAADLAGGEIAMRPVSGEVLFGLPGQTAAGGSATILSEPREVTAEELRLVDPAAFAIPVERGYTDPDQVPQAVSDLAARVAQDRGAVGAFDTAIAFQDFFRRSFAYSLDVPTPPGADPVQSFLEDRIGYCEQFAATFALMMIAQGYPTRVVIGFTPGTEDGQERRVSSDNAHAWPEVWFGPEHGWVRFEPTPAAAANGLDVPEFTRGAGEEDPVAEQSTAAQPPDPGVEEDSRPPSDGGEHQEAEQGTGAAESDGPARRVSAVVAAVLAAAAGLSALTAAAVLLLRRRRTRRREARWAPLAERSAPDGAAADAASARRAEGARRGGGELAWSEIEGELAVRERAIRWLSPTGAWGRRPLRLRLDPTLPPRRALEDLLDRIDAGVVEVSAEDRAAAARIAAARTAAVYAAPLPEPAAESTPGPAEPAPGNHGEGPGFAAHPLRADADRIIALIRRAR